MKILVFADIHGSEQAMDSALQIARRESAQKIVFCGDLFGGWSSSEQEIAQKAKSLEGVLYFVRGNNDFQRHNLLLDNCLEDNAIMYHFRRTLFFTHGHTYNGYRIPPILKEGDALIFGHTHFGSLVKRNGLYVLNVGSLARPRDGIPCYLVLEENGSTLKHLNGENIYFLPWND